MWYTLMCLSIRPPPVGDSVASRQYVSLLIANVVQQQNAVSDIIIDDSSRSPDTPVGLPTAHWDDPDAIMYEDDDDAMS